MAEVRRGKVNNQVVPLSRLISGEMKVKEASKALLDDDCKLVITISRDSTTAEVLVPEMLDAPVSGLGSKPVLVPYKEYKKGMGMLSMLTATSIKEMKDKTDLYYRDGCAALTASGLLNLDLTSENKGKVLAIGRYLLTATAFRSYVEKLPNEKDNVEHNNALRKWIIRICDMIPYLVQNEIKTKGLQSVSADAPYGKGRIPTWIAGRIGAYPFPSRNSKGLEVIPLTKFLFGGTIGTGMYLTYDELDYTDEAPLSTLAGIRRVVRAAFTILPEKEGPALLGGAPNLRHPDVRELTGTKFKYYVPPKEYISIETKRIEAYPHVIVDQVRKFINFLIMARFGRVPPGMAESKTQAGVLTSVEAALDAGFLAALKVRNGTDQKTYKMEFWKLHFAEIAAVGYPGQACNVKFTGEKWVKVETFHTNVPVLFKELTCMTLPEIDFGTGKRRNRTLDHDAVNEAAVTAARDEAGQASKEAPAKPTELLKEGSLPEPPETSGSLTAMPTVLAPNGTLVRYDKEKAVKLRVPEESEAVRRGKAIETIGGTDKGSLTVESPLVVKYLKKLHGVSSKLCDNITLSGATVMTDKSAYVTARFFMRTALAHGSKLARGAEESSDESEDGDDPFK